MSAKVCKECGEPCKQKYCSKLCNNRAWKKSKKFLGKKCKFCRKPCHNLYCSKECSAKSRITEYKELCLICGKEFTYHKTGYKKRGGMKFCSYACAASSYNFDENFFFGGNIPEIYETMGFLFSSGNIVDYSNNEITINSTLELLQNFVSLTKTTYPIKSVIIKNNKKRRIFRISFRSKVVLDYLHNIGLTHAVSKNSFPVILHEYRKYFIKGFLNAPNCLVFNKIDHNLVIVISKSYHIIRTIAEVTGGDMVTKNLEFCCAFKDYDRFYTKYQPQIKELT